MMGLGRDNFALQWWKWVMTDRMFQVLRRGLPRRDVTPPTNRCEGVEFHACWQQTVQCISLMLVRGIQQLCSIYND